MGDEVRRGTGAGGMAQGEGTGGGGMAQGAPVDVIDVDALITNSPSHRDGGGGTPMTSAGAEKLHKVIEVECDSTTQISPSQDTNTVSPRPQHTGSRKSARIGRSPTVVQRVHPGQEAPSSRNTDTVSPRSRAALSPHIKRSPRVKHVCPPSPTPSLQRLNISRDSAQSATKWSPSLMPSGGKRSPAVSHSVKSVNFPSASPASRIHISPTVQHRSGQSPRAPAKDSVQNPTARGDCAQSPTAHRCDSQGSSTISPASQPHQAPTPAKDSSAQSSSHSPPCAPSRLSGVNISSPVQLVTPVTQCSYSMSRSPITESRSQEHVRSPRPVAPQSPMGQPQMDLSPKIGSTAPNAAQQVRKHLA